MQETLQKLQALQGGALGQVSEEQKARRMKAATAAAEEITMSLEMKSSSEPAPGSEEKKEARKGKEKESSEKGSNTAMGVVIHWSGIRGFGILRSQTHGEVRVHAKALMNTAELAVGDVVTFELGFDEEKKKPEANSVYKSGAGGQKPSGDDVRTSTSSSRPGASRVSGSDQDNGQSKDAAKGAAAAAAMKLLNETPSQKTTKESGNKKEKRKSRRKSSSSSSSSSSSRKRRRKSRSRSRSRGRRRR